MSSESSSPWHKQTEIYASAIAIREFPEYKSAMKVRAVIGEDRTGQRGSQRSDEEGMMKRDSAGLHYLTGAGCGPDGECQGKDKRNRLDV